MNIKIEKILFEFNLLLLIKIYLVVFIEKLETKILVTNLYKRLDS